MARRIRILVADDDENDRYFLKRAFIAVGINVAVEMVNDGATAVNYLNGAGPFADRTTFPLPELVVLDINMPGLDGFGVLRWIRGQPGLRQMPVLFLSSSEARKDVDLAHELGANGYSVKPPGPTELQTFVRALEAYWLQCHCYPSLAVTPEIELLEPMGDVKAKGSANQPDLRDSGYGT